MSRTRFLFALLLPLAVAPTTTAAYPFFDAPYRYFMTAGAILGVTAGRFDQDAVADIAVAHPNERTIEILRGTTGGAYLSQVIVDAGLSPRGIVAADLDGDDMLDLAAVGTEPGGVAILRGRGDGRFDLLRVIPLANPGDLLSTGDVDVNGALDLIAGGMVLLNDGPAEFREPIALPSDVTHEPALGRIDADPYPDLVAPPSARYPGDPRQRSVRIRFGAGDGTFERFVEVSTECEPSSTQLGDYDGDGDLDIVVSDGCGDVSGGSGAMILLNEGGAAFSRVTNYARGDAAHFATGDVDGDGAADLVVTAGAVVFGEPTLNVMTLSQAGNFQRQWFGYIHIVPWGGPHVADLNGDGFGDVFFAEGSGVAVFPGASSGNLGHPALSAWQEARTIIAAHIDDGPTLDLMALRPGDDGGITIQLNNGDGTYRRILDGDFNAPNSVIVADVTGDGHPDLVTCTGGDQMNVERGSGTGDFTAIQQVTVGFRGTADSLHADDDAALDIVVAATDSLELWRNSGTGMFTRVGIWPGGGSNIVTRDLNGDGHTDVVLERGSNVVIRLANGVGGFGPEIAFATPTQITQLVVTDIEGDGAPDIVTEHTPATPQWLHGRGDGTFDSIAPLGLIPGFRVTFGDWNGDGRVDAASLCRDDFVVSSWSDHIAVQFGFGDGRFSVPTGLGTGSHPLDLTNGDLDGDGRPDLALLNYGTYDAYYGWLDLMRNLIEPGPMLDVPTIPARLGSGLALGLPSPQPLRFLTRIGLSLPAAAHVTARVVDIAGRQVRELMRGTLAAGTHHLQWDGRDARGAAVPAGIYFVTARTATDLAQRRIVVLR